MTASISPGAGIAQPSAFHLTKTIVLVALVYGIAAFLLYTWNHTFPLGYHPDEESKVRQVLAGEYNFHHPMLLLSGVRTALVLAGNPENPQVVVEWGRTISALYTAIAIGFLVLLAGGWLGPWVAIAAGAFLVTNHQLFELSHYFKEDPAVLLGISATFLAIFWFGEKPTAWRATLLGVATGLAGSGKYVGFLVLPFVLMAIVLERQRLSLRASLPFWAGGLVTIVVLANIPVFLNPAGFAGGFERELGFAVEDPFHTASMEPSFEPQPIP
jgi:dolichyl-phosphate-mannose--protein O-mannosyl transferase